MAVNPDFDDYIIRSPKTFANEGAKTATRERLERTARIVAGGTCPHAIAVPRHQPAGQRDTVYCEKPVDPTTGEHTGPGRYHKAEHVLWEPDDPGAFIE